MDLDEKYENLPTIDFSIITGDENLQSLINEQIKKYNEELSKGIIEINNLKIYKMLLCNIYQKKKWKPPNFEISKFSKNFLSNFSSEQLAIIKDIIILHQFLNSENICQEFENFHNSLEINYNENFMIIIECFIDAFRLIQHKFGIYEKPKNFPSLINRILKIWYLNKKTWQIFISLLSKLKEIEIMEKIDIWKLFIENSDLNGLCIYVNFLKMENEKNFHFLCNEILWEIILNGLKSNETKKQSMFIFKIITEFFEDEFFENEFFKNENFAKIPFICERRKKFLSEERNNFIIILELLEEKKQNLLLPIFGILNDLTKNFDNCTKKWIFCILEKILQHENNAIVKNGLKFILQTNFDFGDNFILILKTLNNRFLYEQEIKNTILDDLGDFFAKTEKNEKFLSSLEKISWDPISIFYVTFAMRKINSLNADEELLNSLKKFQINLPHSELLKETQKSILIILTKIQKIYLKLFVNLIAIFPGENFPNLEFWEIINDFTKKISFNDKEVTNFIFQSCENNLENIENFVRVFVILEKLNYLHEGNKIFLIKLLDNIHMINSRQYVNIKLIDRVIELIYHLTNYQQTKISHPFFNDAHDYFLMIAKKSELNYELIVKYSKYLKTIINHEKRNFINNFFDKFANEVIYSLKNNCSGERRLYGMKILQILQELNNEFINKVIVELIENYSIPLLFHSENCHMGFKGKATMEYYLMIGEILNIYLENNERRGNYFFIASTLFDRAGINGVPIVVELLTKIYQNEFLEKNLEEMKSLIKTCWKSILSGKKNRFFWMTLENILKFILNPNLFQVEKTFVTEMVSEILNEGETASNVKIILLKNLSNLDSKSLCFFKEAILNCLLHGQALRRDIKIEMQTMEFLSMEKNENFQNYNSDNEIRARGIILLHRAICVDENFVTEFFHSLMKNLMRFKGKRYFADSNSHRIQQRIFQCLLIMEPILNLDCRDKLRSEIIDMVLSNSADQPSIQIMMSWILSRIFSGQKNEPDDLWNFFKEVKEKRPGNLKFVAGVILQISKLLDENNENFNNFHTTAISLLAPECLGPTFNTRLACQMTLVKLYERTKNRDNLYKAIIETLNQSNFQIANEFYYQDFHLFNNYSLQSIYYHVPRLKNMCDDELLPIKLFENFNFFPMENHPLILKEESNSKWLQLNPNKPKLEKNEETMGDSIVDFQKKIIPDKLSIFDDRELKNNEKSESIIVVASLVERVPNLGGIARTCEIFGAGELVLGNKMCTENKEFQSLSVTAEKWIRVSEVKPEELTKYLMKMKEKGWNLIGLEQTARSCNILEKKFEKKTLLLLGNEKNGIPANLIPILDNCVEIPQIGVIRSLNVHVTGAICIWEYAKQHCFQ